MSECIKKRLDAVDEELLTWTHKSGLTVCLSQKARSSAFAVLTVRFGSDDGSFRRYPGGDIRELPDGVAHFLEHKMFESEDGTDVFELYAETGAYANAFTTRGHTSYLFSCTDSFEDNLRILLNCVTHPYFTEENVQKELDIIGEEIDMHEDHPGTRISRNLMNAAYALHPVRKSVLGTRETITQITPEMLYDCVRTFYNPRNMLLSVCGNLDPDELDRICDECLPDEAPPFTAVRVLPDEPENVCTERVEAEADIAQPMVAVCLKAVCPADPSACMRILAANEINLELLFGRSGDFFNRLYEEGVIGDRFGAYFSLEDGCAFTEIDAVCDEPDRFLAELYRELEKRAATYFGPDEFEQAKRTVYANALFPLDSTEDTALAVSDSWAQGRNILDALEQVMTMSREEAFSVLQTTMTPDPSRRAVSILYPQSKKTERNTKTKKPARP
ncbi:MAG: insulinase family protein [Clostridia bacterium]|nr:insulinase family protein [Clostridia bacterium]